MTAPEEPGLPSWARRPATADGLSDEFLASYIGPRWESVYRRKLAPFREDPAFVPTWNWAAALFSPAWFVYRKLYLAFAVALLVNTMVVSPLVEWAAGPILPAPGQTMSEADQRRLATILFGMQLATAIASGGIANWLIFRRARAAARLLEQQALGAEERRALLQRIGGVNRGMTLFFLVLLGVVTLLQLMGVRPA
jgi:hypothetical protein